MIVFCSIQTGSKERDSQIDNLLSLMAQGNSSAVGKLYTLIKTDVYAFALSKTANIADAEDLTQNTFVQVYKNAKLYKSQSKPMAWIFTIELNLIRRHFQLKKRLTPFEEMDSELIEPSNTEDKVIKSELVRTLLSILNEDEREVVVLHLISGFKHREISKLLNKPLSTVLSKYNRAIKKLQSSVKE